jgi:uncharacterized protein involved in outer membrane biogenesis
LTLAADLQPIAVLRDASIPYETDIKLTSGDTTLRFDGTMTKPFALDGARGKLTLHAPTLTTLLAVIGADSDLKASLDLAGTLTRADALWVLTDAAGQLNDSDFSGSMLRLLDGGRGKPDKVALDLGFGRLHLDKLLNGKGGEPITVDQAPDPEFDARLMARQTTFQGNIATDVKLAIAVTAGRVDVDEVAATAFGARWQGSAHAEAIDKASQLSAELSVSGVDVQQLRRAIGARDLPLTGRLDARMAADSVGRSLDSAIKAAHVTAVASMRGGSIAQDLVEKASADIRRLFRAPKGMTPIACLLGVVDMRAGVGVVSPLRIRTAAGTIAGQGRFDLNRQLLDLTVGSQSTTTGDFALDVPFRISGPFGNPNIEPSRSRPSLATADLSRLPPALGIVARQNPCLSAR